MGCNTIFDTLDLKRPALVRLLAIALAALALAAGIALVGAPGEAYAASSIGKPQMQVSLGAQSVESKVADISLEGIDGSLETLNGTYGGEKRVVIVGRGGCGKTERAVAAATELAQDALYADVRFLILDIDADKEAFTADYAGSQGDRVRLYTPFENSGTDYNRWAWSAYKAHSGRSSHVMLPFVFCIGPDGDILASTTDDQNFRETVSDAFGLDDPRVKLVSLRISGTYAYEDARSLLGLVNSARDAAGSPALTWSSELEKAAIQRASELRVLYDHCRPNSSMFYSVVPEGLGGHTGENIAYGYASSSAVNAGWTESSDHYANMVDGGYSSMAAASFTAGGVTYWVELFSDAIGDGAFASDSSSAPVTSEVEVIAGDLRIVIDRALTLNAGSSQRISAHVELNMILPHDDLIEEYSMFYDGESFDIDDDNYVWASSDESVASVSANGEVIGKGVGTADITCSLKDLQDVVTANCRVRVLASQDPIVEPDEGVQEGSSGVASGAVGDGSGGDSAGLEYQATEPDPASTRLSDSGASANASLAPNSTYFKKVTSGKRKATLKWAKGASAVDGYQIRYSQKKSMKGAVYKDVAKSKTKLVVKRLKKGKKYWFQIRTCRNAGDAMLYSAWSDKARLKVR